MSIKKITIELDGKEIDLTLEQAKQMHRQLAELFASQPNVPYFPYVPAVWPSDPMPNTTTITAASEGYFVSPMTAAECDELGYKLDDIVGRKPF